MFRFDGSDNPDTYFKDTERTRVVSRSTAAIEIMIENFLTILKVKTLTT